MADPDLWLAPCVVKPTIRLIQQIVAQHENVSIASMLSERRDQPTAGARQKAMFLARHMCHRSLPVIASQFDRDSSTVHFGIGQVERRAMAAPAYRQDLISLSEVIARATERQDGHPDQLSFSGITQPTSASA